MVSCSSTNSTHAHNFSVNRSLQGQFSGFCVSWPLILHLVFRFPLIVLLPSHIPFKFNNVIERVAGQASKFMAQTVDPKAGGSGGSGGDRGAARALESGK